MRFKDHRSFFPHPRFLVVGYCALVEGVSGKVWFHRPDEGLDDPDAFGKILHDCAMHAQSCRRDVAPTEWFGADIGRDGDDDK